MHTHLESAVNVVHACAEVHGDSELDIAGSAKVVDTSWVVVRECQSLQTPLCIYARWPANGALQVKEQTLLGRQAVLPRPARNT